MPQHIASLDRQVRRMLTRKVWRWRPLLFERQQLAGQSITAASRIRLATRIPDSTDTASLSAEAVAQSREKVTGPVTVERISPHRGESNHLTYLELDGWEYWTMGAPVRDTTVITARSSHMRAATWRELAGSR